MPNIEQEIEQISADLEKSNETPKERLFATIRQLGPDGVRARLSTLEKAEKELLVDALREMNKAVEMDKNYAAAKYVQGKLTDTKIQEDIADDNADEKLVSKDPEAATVNHQGTPTEGWEGQVIKGKGMDKKDIEQIAGKEEKEIGEPDKKMPDKKAVKCMKKGEMPFGDLKDDKKSKDEKKQALKKIKKSVEDQIREFGVEATPELVKAEIKRLLKEEDQDGDAPEMNEKTRATKENVPAIELGKDNKEAQKKVNDEKQGKIKKAIWGDENDLLKANTNGRNHHFSMDEYLTEVLKDAEKTPEPIQKSDDGKEDLNDIIAKGGDANWDMVNTDRLLKANTQKIKGKFVKSFEDDEIAQALGLSEEEAKKILGE